jgi:tRNA pseudouridine55 synthase
VEAALARFRGNIEQIPPMHSAIKHRGRPLYDYARKGVEIDRAPRPVTVHALDLLAFGDGIVTVSVHCSKGTYIRVLAEDLGEALGCGAHLAALRRTASGPFTVEAARTFEVLDSLDEPGRDRQLLAPDTLVEHLPALALDPESSWAAVHGQAFWRPRQRVGEWLRLYDGTGEFIGIAEVDEEGRVAPRRMLRSTLAAESQIP